MATEFRAWAMRTSRNTQEHRQFIRRELDSGRLRQGWGYASEQDLRTIQTIIDNKGRAALSEDQKYAWAHWRMLGEGLHEEGAGMRIGDIVLVPNIPSEGYFTLYRIAGPYQYSIDPVTDDFGHFHEVETLTPGGVANTNNLVSGDLRRTETTIGGWRWDVVTADQQELGGQVFRGCGASQKQHLSERSGNPLDYGIKKTLFRIGVLNIKTVDKFFFSAHCVKYLVSTFAVT